MNDVLKRLLEHGAVAVLRLADESVLLPVTEALYEGGVRFLEITMTMSNAVSHIRAMCDAAPSDMVVGAGTVTSVDEVDAVVDAGARFVVSPTLDVAVVEKCRQWGVVVAPGCFSPTEIVAADRAGAHLIKVFPAGILGPAYLKALRGPLPDVRLMPTGGVTVDNAGDWLQAGAAAVAIGGDLLKPSAIAGGDYETLTDRARRLIRNIHDARKR